MADQVLADELANDPLGRGYAGMTDQQAADDLNTKYRTNTSEDASVTGPEIWNALDTTEYNALAAADKEIVDLIGLMNQVNIGAGNIKAQLFALFDAQSASRANLIALLDISRAVEIGVTDIPVKAGQVADNR